MAKLPEIQPRGAITRGPQSSVSPAEVANPFRQIGQALADWGDTFQKKEMADAATAGENAVYRDNQGNLKVEMRSNLSAKGRAYNAAAAQGYTARVAGDIRAAGVRISNEAKGNIDTFDGAWTGFRDQLLQNVPEEYQGAVLTMLDTEGPRLRLGVSEQKRTADIKEYEGNIKSEIQMLDDEASTLARSGGVGTTAYLEKTQQIRTLYQQLADNPDFVVGQTEADIALKRMEGRHMSEAMLGQVDKALSGPNGLAEAQKLSNAILTDDKIPLSPAERRQYAGLANERINGFVAQAKANLKPVQDRSQQIQKRLKEGVGLDADDVDKTAMELARGGDLAGATELISTRAMARTLQGFRSSPNSVQVNQAESLLARASGGDTIIAAMQEVESGGDATSVSSKGATGLMQVMPETADEIAGDLGDVNFPKNGTVEQKQAYLKNPEISRQYGTHYFNKMLTRYNGDKEAALIAYNGGPQRADAWLAAGRDDSVLPKESAAYYKKVLGKASSIVTFSPEEATSAKGFLQGRTDKAPEAITGLQDGFAVKLARMMQDAPPEIRNGLGVFSGMRTPQRQAEIISENAAKYGIDRKAWEADVAKLGPIEAGKKWAGEFKRSGLSENIGKPGGSYHQKGTAADLSYNGQSLAQAPANVVGWLHDNAAKYGLKFPLANENWHIEDDSTRSGVPSSPVDPELVKEYRQEVTSDARALFADIKSGNDRGLTPTVSNIDLLNRQLAVVDDQDFRNEVADYFATQLATDSAMVMAPAQLESLIAGLRADNADGFTVAQSQMVAGLEEAAKAQQAALKDDPLGYAMNRRLVSNLPPLDLQNPDSWAGTFQAYQSAVDVVRARGLTGNIPALRPGAQQELQRRLATSTPEEQIQLLGTMQQNLSPDTYQATISAIAGKGASLPVAAAGALVGVNPQAAEGILRGQALLAQNPNLAPKQTDENAALVDEVLPPSVFAPALEGARQQILEAARARYADLANQVGDTSGQLNDSRMQQAVQEVTGGLVEMNGHQVIAPRYGASQQEFDQLLEGLSDADLQGAVTSSGTRVKPQDLLNEGRLRAVADGRYVLEFGPEDAPTYALRQPSPGSYGGPSVFVLDLRGK
ncbi:transglycosylase SLT domain-containing protein [Gellertiella hungarica]|uniref:Transglycosylase SLT domain-containing protein n=1 Tax=Gellertiella hungarica TaxID=1572859 RepID=A0A7W6J8I5_9HYPH|nr:transglycosylase SLT domain-containing protein [Gellertiella hungarica]MBB4066751.1 hypothetical protein [Gellertiella hungarica]